MSDYSDTERAILNILKEGGELSPSELALRADIEVNEVRRAALSLCSFGEIILTADYKYRYIRPGSFR